MLLILFSVNLFGIHGREKIDFVTKPAIWPYINAELISISKQFKKGCKKVHNKTVTGRPVKEIWSFLSLNFISVSKKFWPITTFSEKSLNKFFNEFKVIKHSASFVGHVLAVLQL